MKVSEDAATELPLNDEKKPKPSRHVVIALNHLNKRRDVLMAHRDKLASEIKEIDAALVALGVSE